MGKSYHGYASGDVVVWDGLGGCRMLSMRLDVRSHSPTGFAWGYNGSGSAQLALAIMSDAMPAQLTKVQQCYQSFKRDVIAEFPQGRPFVLSEQDVQNWVRWWEESCFDTVWEYFEDEDRVAAIDSPQYQSLKVLWRKAGAPIDEHLVSWVIGEVATQTYTLIV